MHFSSYREQRGRCEMKNAKGSGGDLRTLLTQLMAVRVIQPTLYLVTVYNHSIKSEITVPKLFMNYGCLVEKPHLKMIPLRLEISLF